jgi:hypothetical protein
MVPVYRQRALRQVFTHARARIGAKRGFTDALLQII